MRRIFSIVLAVVLVFVMSVSAFGMEISTVVPDKHTVTVDYNDGGYALVNGKLCLSGTQFQVNRFGEIDLGVICKNGYHIDSIAVNGVYFTELYVDGNLNVSNIVNDTLVQITFEKCSNDAQDKCGKVDIEGTVYLGDKALQNADVSFDFGSVTDKTNKNGRYHVDDIADGKHIVTISKDGEDLAHFFFVIQRADVEKTTIKTADDGTQVVVIPHDEDIVYLDFNIIDNDNNSIPDKDPDDTDPGDPSNPPVIDPDGNPEGTDPDKDTDGDGIPDADDPDDDDDGIPDENDPDKDNDGHIDDYDGTPDGDDDDDGVVIKIGGPEKDVPVIDIPNTFNEFIGHPITIVSVMGLSLFLFFIILFKRKKDDEDEREIIVE